MLNDLGARLEELEARSYVVADDLEDDLDALVTDIVAVFALAQESMLRDQAWLFLDTSKAGRRRWCDMADCGNAAKSRRHYARGRRRA